MTDKYDVIYQNKVVSRINPRLIESRGISDKTLSEISNLHLRRHIIFENARRYWKDFENVQADHMKEILLDAIKELVILFEENEFALQELWGFPKDASMHRWFSFPGCECPILDNEERMGVPSAGRIISGSCLIHNGGIQ